MPVLGAQISTYPSRSWRPALVIRRGPIIIYRSLLVDPACDGFKAWQQVLLKCRRQLVFETACIAD